MKKAMESHEVPGCADNAALAVAAGSTEGSWVFPAAVLLTEPALQSDTCVGLLGWSGIKGTFRAGILPALHRGAVCSMKLPPAQ